jgi:hypothetical protein
MWCRKLAPALLASVLVAACGPGCYQDNRVRLREPAERVYPPPPQIPRVLVLGTLAPPMPGPPMSVELALFLFGTEPALPPSIVCPSGLTAVDDVVFICDPSQGMVWRWDATDGQLRDATPGTHWDQPFAVEVAPDKALLICDRRGVWRWSGRGSVRPAFSESQTAAVADVLVVHDEVWLTNQALHRIDVYDYATGEYRRSIGRPGTALGEFAFPRGMARMPDGRVCVVDMLNNRVQVFDDQGRALHQIGQAGDVVGTLGRPRDVAVGPDGTVFVSDAFSQRIHVYSLAGDPLLAFGEPGSGSGALMLPHGIAVTTYRPPTTSGDAIGEQPAYYVLVAEQLADPGVRVYAWMGNAEAGPGLPPADEVARRPSKFPQSAAINPHWHPERCARCHESDGGRAIEPARVDGLCLSCHDGVQAPADPHPIGRRAVSEVAQTPPDWPTVNGVIGCLTCHDIRRHCDPQARRPAANPALLRHYDPQQPLAYCGQCHPSDRAGRFSPHRQRDDTGQPREEACLFCHTRTPDVPADGRRRFEPWLRTESSALCTNCHSPHWDLSPRGHVDRPVTPAIREWMIIRELSRTSDASWDDLVRAAQAPDRHPARLPLGNDQVTCYTCHNPHYAGLFPPDTELGALARNPADRASALRTDWIELCSECHRR